MTFRKRHSTGMFALAILVCAIAAQSAVAGPQADPLNSPAWKEIAKQTFGSSELVFDERVKIVVPTIVENQAQVPVIADARGLDHVVSMKVFADLNPIQHVLTLTPTRAAPYISFRMKVEQATPVRAAALTSDGVWHVGGVFLDAAGGGCTSPALARNKDSWWNTLGQAQGRVWRETSGLTRARFRFLHPMDTGLSKDNLPAYYIEKASLKDASGSELAKLEMFEPVSENPTLTLLVDLPQADSALTIDARDNNGRLYSAQIPAPSRQSNLVPKQTCAANSSC